MKPLFAKTIAPALLILVASTQIIFLTQHDISKWKGGGFGMFSSSDTPGGRSIDVILILDSGERYASIPSDEQLDRLSEIAKIFPSDKRLTKLLSVLSAESWYCADEPSEINLSGNKCLVALEAKAILNDLEQNSYEYNLFSEVIPESIRIDVRKQEYISSKSAYTRRVIRSLELKLIGS